MPAGAIVFETPFASVLGWPSFCRLHGIQDHSPTPFGMSAFVAFVVTEQEYPMWSVSVGTANTIVLPTHAAITAEVSRGSPSRHSTARSEQP
jgi:hypothetical protein